MFKPELSVSISCIESVGYIDGKYRYKISDDYCYKIKKAKELGFKGIELDFCGACYSWVYDELADELCSTVIENGLKLNSIHFPFSVEWMDLTCPWEIDRKGIIAWISKMFSICDKYNPRAYVFHPSNCTPCTQENYDELMQRLCDTVEELASNTKTYVCVENMVRGLNDTCDKLLDYCSKCKKAQVVLDVNHLLHDKQEDVIRKLGGRIKTLHISDYDRENERHWMPTEGIIDFNEVLKALEDIGYDGMFNYEVLGKYSLEQIKDNYDLLMSNFSKKYGK